MTDYPVGTVATATVRGVEGVRVVRASVDCWWSAENVGGTRYALARYVTDIRPLVVLDLKRSTPPVAPAGIVRLAARLLDDGRSGYESEARWLDDIAEQMEAQSKPPRIPEPGLWAVVEASRREHDGSTRRAQGKWIRVDAMLNPWTHTSGEFTAAWSDLIDPTLIREGVDSDD